MEKCKGWIGILALALLIVQSSIGIIMYAEGGDTAPTQGFSGGGNRPMMKGEGNNGPGAMLPPSNGSTEDTEASSASESTEDTASSSQMNPSQNEKTPSVGMDPGEEFSSFTIT